MIKPEVNKYYQHRYGGLYRLQDIATNAVDNTTWVVYAHCYPFEYRVWIRPYNEWTVGRFREITEDEYQKFIEGDRVSFQKAILNNKLEEKDK